MYLEETTIYLYEFSINEIRVESRKVAEDRYKSSTTTALVERHKMFYQDSVRASSSIDCLFESCNNSCNDLKLHKCTPGDEIAMRYLFWYCHIKTNSDRCAKRSFNIAEFPARFFVTASSPCGAIKKDYIDEKNCTVRALRAPVETYNRS